MLPQITLVLIALVISLTFLSRAIPLALTNPNGFPSGPWGWPERLLTAGLVLFFLAMGASSFGKPPGRVDMGALGTSLLLYLALIFLVTGFLVFRNFNLRETFGLNVTGWSWRIIAGWLVMFLPLVYSLQMLSYALSGPDQGPQAIVNFLLENHRWEARAAVFGLAVFAAPVTEELIFRGCLYGVLRKSRGRLPAIVITSILFALIHGHLPSLPGLLVLATGLALIYERCGSLWAPISMHAAFNGLTILTAIFLPGLDK